MTLKPWYQVVTPREDLREGRPLDASEFAVHLDKVRTNEAPEVYTDPEQFFQRTFLTKNLSDLAKEVMRRLSGETVETNAVFNLATQFGGGKTHALALLYHLAKNGATVCAGWSGSGQAGFLCSNVSTFCAGWSGCGQAGFFCSNGSTFSTRG